MKKDSRSSQHVTIAMFEKHEAVFEKSMRGIADSFALVNKSFEKVFEKLDKHDKFFEIISRETQEYRREARDHRMLMSALSQAEISHQRLIDGLENRVEKLEAKIK